LCGAEVSDVLPSFLEETSNWLEKKAKYPKFDTCLGYKLDLASIRAAPPVAIATKSESNSKVLFTVK
jgi:hypothetical protein